uniref:Uncharacterized protein n=1 Tax=Arundo donax TaxID=35708 RepID=A0A0A9DNJ6_ARUDO
MVCLVCLSIMGCEGLFDSTVALSDSSDFVRLMFHSLGSKFLICPLDGTLSEATIRIGNVPTILFVAVAFLDTASGFTNLSVPLLSAAAFTDGKLSSPISLAIRLGTLTFESSVLPLEAWPLELFVTVVSCKAELWFGLEL